MAGKQLMHATIPLRLSVTVQSQQEQFWVLVPIQCCSSPNNSLHSVTPLSANQPHGEQSGVFLAAGIQTRLDVTIVCTSKMIPYHEADLDLGQVNNGAVTSASSVSLSFFPIQNQAEVLFHA